MSTLSNEKISEIRNSVDIVDVISNYISLTKKGKNYFCQCPFHTDKTPSLSVSSDKQIYSCFSCHRAGNVFNFLMEYEQLTFMEAVAYVAKLGGINVSVNTNVKKTDLNLNLYNIYDTSLKFYVNNINTVLGKRAIEYLSSRNINEEIIKEFQIGLALRKTDSLSQILEKKEYLEKDLIDSTLVIKDNNKFHDFFYDRILFPLHDINNKVIGYSGRIYDESDNPKYVNSREHKLFKKGEFLYNYYKAKEECRKNSSVIITEGFLDVIRCYTVGVKNVIATMGTAFTKEHISLIKRLSNNVILCFDGDKAGINATEASSKILIESGIIPKVIVLEEGLDPDSYILEKGSEKFLDKVNNPIGIMDFKLFYHKRNLNLTQIEDKAKYTSLIIEELNNIDDELIIEMTLKKLSIEVDLDYQYLKNKINKKETEIVINIIPTKTNKYDKAQSGLIFYMLRDVEVIKMVDNKMLLFPDKKYRLLSQEIIHYYKKNDEINISDLMSILNDELISLVGFIETLDFNESFEYSIIEDFIKAIEEKNINDQCLRLTKRINEEIDSVEKARLSQMIIDLLVRREKDV